MLNITDIHSVMMPIIILEFTRVIMLWHQVEWAMQGYICLSQKLLSSSFHLHLYRSWASFEYRAFAQCRILPVQFIYV